MSWEERELLIAILTAHQRGHSGCVCGWSQVVGESHAGHAGHVAAEYEAALRSALRSAVRVSTSRRRHDA